MSPEEVPAEWVEAAADELVGSWDGAWIAREIARQMARDALAAVLPPAQSEAWKQGALTADPNLDPSVADEYNPYPEGSGGEG